MRLDRIIGTIEEIRRARLSKNSTSRAAAVDEDRIGDLEKLRDDLMKVRRAEVNKGSSGSNTAKNLIQQNMLTAYRHGRTRFSRRRRTLGGVPGYAAGYVANYLTRGRHEKSTGKVIEKLTNELLGAGRSAE